MPAHGGGGGASDCKVTSADLKAIGNEAQQLFHMEADDISEKYSEDELLKKKSDDPKDEALETGKSNALMPGQA